MKNCRVLFIFLFAQMVALGACSSEAVEYGVKGLPGMFCIPEKHEPSTPFWMPIRPEEYRDGFFVTGCWKPGVRDDACALPPNVLTVGVKSLSDFSGWDWSDFPADSFIRQLPTREGTQLALLEQGRYIAVQNKALWNDKYIWRIREEHVGASIPQAGDTLLLICSQERLQTNAGNATEATICERRVSAQEYAISYSFELSAMESGVVEKLDFDIIRTLESWRCASQ